MMSITKECKMDCVVEGIKIIKKNGIEMGEVTLKDFFNKKHKIEVMKKELPLFKIYQESSLHLIDSTGS